MPTIPSEVLAQVPHFTESKSVALWSAFMPLAVSYDQFVTAVLKNAYADKQRYTGFMTRADDDQMTSFTRTRYPRAKYGIAPVASCQEGTNNLASDLDTRVFPDAQEKGIRVVLGLLEGYDTSNPRHTIEEVQASLPQAVITPAEVFALRINEEDYSPYTEPVAVIQVARSAIRAVYGLADAFKQERFAVENFDTGLAYMVETRYCTEPDIVLPPLPEY